MLLSRDEARELDRRAIEEFGVPGIVLMENAGRGMADLMRNLGIRGPVVICCGKGNNGGDGFVIARHLDSARYSVRVLLFADPKSLTGDAAVNYRIVLRSGIPVLAAIGPKVNAGQVQAELASADWIVDALFGTGLKGPMQAPYDTVVKVINARVTRVLAVDIPSGLDCDTGQPLGPTVIATHTAAVVAPHKGFVEPAAREWIGQVHVIDIGIPRRALEALRR